MLVAPLGGEEGGCPQIFLKSSPKGETKGIKGRRILLTSKNERLRDVFMAGKKVDKMQERKDSSKEESPIPLLILMALILLGGILLAGLIIFSE